MAIDLSALSNSVSNANALGNLILVTPQKNIGYRAQSKDGKTLEPSLLFHYEGEQTATITSDITDHFVEDNTAINDHIALRPEIITTRGFIGELNNVLPPELEPLRKAKERLTSISGYEPGLSAAAIRAYDNAFSAYQAAKNISNSAISTWKSITGKNVVNQIGSSGLRDGSPDKSQTLQQIYFQQFYGYWRERRLFTIQTPWAIFNNMAIVSLRAIQAEDSDSVSDFEIQFKMIRFAKTITELKTEEGRASTQNAAEVNKGTQRPLIDTSVTMVG